MSFKIEKKWIEAFLINGFHSWMFIYGKVSPLKLIKPALSRFKSRRRNHAFVRNAHSRIHDFLTHLHFLFKRKMSALDSVNKTVKTHDITS